MQISLFYRKQSPEYHSIEKIFDTVCDNFSDEISFKKIYTKHKSKGLINRLLICFNARKNQSEINHITGDIHFIAPFLKKEQTILTIHDIGIIKSGFFIKRFIIKLFWFAIPFKKVKFVTVISDFTKSEILNNFKINSEKIIVIPNCIPDIYKYSEKSFDTEKPTILQIGTKKNKNLERLIEAISDINCKLIIIGKLSQTQNALLSKNNINFKVFFNISDEKLLKLYQNADIISFISTYEGFGMPVIEANAVGRLVITSDIEPMKSIAKNSALFVNPYNIKEIKSGIENLINNSDLRNKLINNGLNNAKKYSAKEIAAKYETLYKSLIKND